MIILFALFSKLIKAESEIWKNGIYTYKIYLDTQWLLIFYHNASKGFFNDREDAKYSIRPGLYSILSRISNERYVHRFDINKYEFLLEYPDDYKGQYNRWSQSKDPLKDPEEKLGGVDYQKATGFNKDKLSWEEKFGGLMLSVSNSTLLDGQTGEAYFRYAIGDYTNTRNGKIPGPVDNNGVHDVSSVSLWIRISSPYCMIVTNRKNLYFLKLSIFIMIFIVISS